MIAYYRQGMSYTNYLSLSKYKNDKNQNNYCLHTMNAYICNIVLKKI